MKSLTSNVLGVFALTVAAGCSSAKITKSHPMYGKEKLPKAEPIYAYPFAASHADLLAWSPAAKHRNSSGAPPSPKLAEGNLGRLESSHG